MSPSRPVEILLVTPALPAVTGNGLAMRAGSALRGLARLGRVTLLVVADVPATDATGTPADRVLDASLAPLVGAVVVHEPAGPTADDAVSWLASTSARDRLARLEPLADAVRAASPRAVADLADRVRDAHPGPFDLVHVLRLRCAPWAEPFGHGAATVVDLDDDEVATHHRLGGELGRRGHDRDAAALAAEAEALGRWADELLPSAAAVAVASPDDAEPVRRHGNDRVLVVPNAVDPTGPTRALRPERPDRAAPRLLFVGNLRYAPNVWGAEWFVESVLPLLRSRLHDTAKIVDDVVVDVVGAGGPEVATLAGVAGVEVHGPVTDLAPLYAAASVAIVPVTVGGGTRLKLLEAAARGVPVVSTTVGAAGLGVVDGRHALVADDPPSFADACVRLLGDRPLAARLAAEARRLVEERFAAPVVEARLAADLHALLAERG